MPNVRHHERVRQGAEKEWTIRTMAEQEPEQGGLNGGVLLPPHSIRHVKKAYEQVADQLRELIARGVLAPGERLPNETQLANQFGVSRATIREALRLLAAESLLRTSRGKGGGSFVNLPSIENISDFVGASISLLTDAETVSLEELLETRELLEVPAARLAAVRRTDHDLERLHALAPPNFRQFGASKQFL
jgi:GntR family transcriptional regulator, transcriptional repressor for pyruvate dehydrogenase complex